LLAGAVGALALLVVLQASAARAEAWLAAEDRPDCAVAVAEQIDGQTASWDGACRDGKADGSGLFVRRWGPADAPREERYTGTLKAGIKDGRGTLTLANGGRYEGEFVAGRREGQGRFDAHQGWVYEGGFLNNRLHGDGVSIWPNGDRHAGGYVKGRRHGPGTYVSHEGWRYEGDFENGRRSGKGTIHLADGRTFTGPFRTGKAHGRGICTDQDGAIRGCYYHRGRFDGWAD
jgi:hypothetical protein